MNKIREIVYPHSLIQPQHLILARREELLAKEKTLDNLILFDSLPDRYQMSATVLWDCLLALKIEPQQLDGQIYFTTSNLKRLEQFIKRVEISWACSHILGTCCVADRKT